MRDVIVIGAGGGGPVVAKELAARGLDVLLLEAGGSHADSERAWTHFENDAINPATGFFRFSPADRTRPTWTREQPQSGYVYQLSGVGGTTKHYLGNSPRAMPGAFAGYEGADVAAYDTTHLFPFTYDDLRPYYEWVEATLPVQTAAMGTKEAVFFRGAERIGLPVQTSKDISRDAFRPQENAILQPRGNAGRTTDPSRLTFPKAGGCTFCGYCTVGCYQPIAAPRNLKAKRSTDNSYVPMALTADRWMPGGRAVTLLTDAFATQVHTEHRGGETVATGVTWRVGATGERLREDAKVVVLAAGVVENPRLWLNSGLPNPNDWVGRGLTDHFLDVVVAVMPEYTGSSKGAGSSARADFPGRGCIEQAAFGPSSLATLATLSASGMQRFYDNGDGWAGGADGAGRVVGRQLADLMENLDNLLTTLIITDDDVEAQNRVSLSSLMPADEHGPVPKVEMRHRQRSARTLANRRFLVERAVQLARSAGATEVHRIGMPPLMLHVHSTMRMGRSAERSVLDEHAEARWVQRLFVADNAALANALGGPNPTLTTQALATRAAERIVQRYFDGDPWVGREAPVSSVDDRVTAAVVAGGPADPVAPVTPVSIGTTATTATAGTAAPRGAEPAGNGVAATLPATGTSSRTLPVGAGTALLGLGAGAAARAVHERSSG